MTPSQLLKEALLARRRSYAPYSHYCVGAALLTEDGRIYHGCNIENVAYGPTVCAERVAFFKAVSEGQTHFSAIAITGGPEAADENELTPAYPCGVCRQVMAEFCQPDFKIYCGSPENPQIFTLEELLPHSFHDLT